AGLIRRGPPVGDLTRQPGTGFGELTDTVLNAVFAEVAEVGAEGVCLDAVGSGLEVCVVHGSHDVGTGDVEYLVAAFMTVEVVDIDIGGLQHGAHGPVGHQYPVAVDGKLRGRHQSRLAATADNR